MKVKSVGHLVRLAEQRRAVTFRSHHNLDRRPAAFVIHMPAVTVQRWIDSGLYVYNPRKK